jgi:hypothetical protein
MGDKFYVPMQARVCMDLRIYIFMYVLTTVIDNHSLKMADGSQKQPCRNQGNQRATYFTQHADW